MADVIDAVRVAIMAKLKAELPAASGIAGVGIYDHAPQNMAMPAVTLDRVIDEPDDLLDEEVSRVTVTLTLWSTARGPREANHLRAGIRQTLHDATLALSEGESILCRYQRGDVTRDGDGVTYMGSVLIAALIEH